MFHKKMRGDGLKKGTIIDTVNVNDVIRPVQLFYERRRNCTVSIGKKTITIRIPIFLNREEKQREIQKLKEWAIQRIQKNPERFKPKPPRTYHNGDILTVGNKQYHIHITRNDKKGSSARLSGTIITLNLSCHLSQQQEQHHITTLLSRCIARERLPYLEETIKTLNGKHFNKNINKILFKHNKSNWGSCSRKGNINISTRLLFAPDDVLEYVCIHELAHLLVPNHSERFWMLVESAMPNYEEKEQWLKDNKDSCRF